MDILAALVSTGGGVRKFLLCVAWYAIPNVSWASSGGDTVVLSAFAGLPDAWSSLHSGVPGASHKCSPIIEISTSFPHCEHFMVGKNADSRGKAMMCQ